MPDSYAKLRGYLGRVKKKPRRGGTLEGTDEEVAIKASKDAAPRFDVTERVKGGTLRTPSEPLTEAEQERLDMREERRRRAR